MVRIYHNPRCSKSRQTLELLRQRGIDPEIIHYLETPPDRATLADLVSKLGISPRQLLRRGEPEYREQALDNRDLSDTDLLDAMVQYPKLIERPIVVNGDRAAIGRPPETVLEIL